MGVTRPLLIELIRVSDDHNAASPSRPPLAQDNVKREPGKKDFIDLTAIETSCMVKKMSAEAQVRNGELTEQQGALFVKAVDVFLALHKLGSEETEPDEVKRLSFEEMTDEAITTNLQTLPKRAGTEPGALPPPSPYEPGKWDDILPA